MEGEQFRHVLRCDHLAGPKPITLMELLMVDTVWRI
jgi:hypothetical protein